MAISSNQLEPQGLVAFKKLPPVVNFDELDIPEVAENRRATNVRWLVTLGTTIGILIAFLIYTLWHSDISRLAGYDSCGNICGENNKQWEGIECSGQDLTSKPYLNTKDVFVGAQYSSWSTVRGTCVAICPSGYVNFNWECVDASTKYHEKNDYGDYVQSDVNRDDYEETSFISYIRSITWHFIISCLLSILVVWGMLLLFRFAIVTVVWLILISVCIALFAAAATSWYYSSTIGGILSTVLAILFGLYLIFFRKSIRLMVLTLGQATQAVFRMPRMIFVAFICFLSITIISGLFLLLSAYLLSSGTLQRVGEESHEYVKNPVMIFTFVFNVVVYLWVSQFFVGIQYMVIAGAVSKWYFTRDKNQLSQPIMTSAAITFKYHLGTVAFGSFLLTVILIIKYIFLILSKVRGSRLFGTCICNSIEKLFKILSKNAYITTALHGESFLRSGNRAAQLIFRYLSEIMSLNYIGDIVLGITAIVIIIVSVSLCKLILYISPSSASYLDFYLLIAVGIFALIGGNILFVSVLQTAMATIFVCYCEDTLLNDGMARPYFMSRDLMEFMRNSKNIRKN